MRFLEEIKKWHDELIEIGFLAIALVMAFDILFDLAPFFAEVKLLLTSLFGSGSLAIIAVMPVIFLLARRILVLKTDTAKPIVREMRSWLSHKNNAKSNHIQLAASVIYLSRLIKSMVWVYVTVAGAIFLHAVSAAIMGSTVSLHLIFLSLGLLVLLVLREGLIRYRIQKGYFGLNAHEARQLISFVIKNAEKVNFTDSSGKPMKALLPIQQKGAELEIAGEGAIT